MNNLTLYALALKKTWWILGFIVFAIISTGFIEMVERKWEER